MSNDVSPDRPGLIARLFARVSAWFSARLSARPSARLSANLSKWLRPCLYLSLAAAVVLLDQWSKALALAQLDYGRPLPLLPVLDLTLLYNTGAAFSFLSGAGGWQRWFLAAVAVVVSLVLLVWLFRLRRGEWLVGLSLGCILGGAVGNLWDRLQLGYVVDFISVHWGGAYFPAFNVADAAITLGAGLMILDVLLQWRRGGGRDGAGGAA